VRPRLRVLEHVADQLLGALGDDVRLGGALALGAHVEHRADAQATERPQVLAAEVVQFH